MPEFIGSRGRLIYFRRRLTIRTVSQIGFGGEKFKNKCYDI